MIEQLICLLREELTLTAEEIADILWLAVIRRQSSAEISPEAPFSSPKSTVPLEASEASFPSPDELPFPSPESAVPLEASFSSPKAIPIQPPPQPDKGVVRSLLIRVPNAPLIRRSLPLARALQPLRQGIFSRTSSVLDEVATAQKIAEKQAWMPVLQPVSEPWLEVALVVDESISEVIWRSTILEVKKLLENYSLFRNIQTWGLRKNQYGQMKVRPSFGFSSRSQIFQDPERLVDPTGQRLILIVTDCVSSIWNDGSILPALRIWTQNNPLAILQMLPEYMWFRTKLEQALAVEFRSPKPASANRNLFVRSNGLWDEFDPLGVKVPIFTLEPKMALMWSRMVASLATSWAPGFIFEQSNQLFGQDELYLWPQQGLSAEERVQRFRISASGTAKRLAALLAGVPIISFPIIRLIQYTCIPTAASQVHVVEILLGGLFESLPSLEPKINPDELLFDFVAGVRELLLDEVVVQDFLSVLKVFLRLIADQRGMNFKEFLNLVMNPQPIEDRDFVEMLRFIQAPLLQILTHFNMSTESLIDELLYNSKNR